jgi:hypothetical protein
MATAEFRCSTLWLPRTTSPAAPPGVAWWMVADGSGGGCAASRLRTIQDAHDRPGHLQAAFAQAHYLVGDQAAFWVEPSTSPADAWPHPGRSPPPPRSSAPRRGPVDHQAGCRRQLTRAVSGGHPRPLDRHPAAPRVSPARGRGAPRSGPGRACPLGAGRRVHRLLHQQPQQLHLRSHGQGQQALVADSAISASATDTCSGMVSPGMLAWTSVVWYCLAVAVPILAVLLAAHPRPTRRQDAGGDRHRKISQSPDTWSAGHCCHSWPGRATIAIPWSVV